jgi:hypothetical protein
VEWWVSSFFQFSVISRGRRVQFSVISRGRSVQFLDFSFEILGYQGKILG